MEGCFVSSGVASSPKQPFSLGTYENTQGYRRPPGHPPFQPQNDWNVAQAGSDPQQQIAMVLLSSLLTTRTERPPTRSAWRGTGCQQD